MSYRIACHTLFDITKTGVLNRARPADDVTDIDKWVNQRASQCNYDTILQVISLRAQPDNSTSPIETIVDLSKKHMFGNVFTKGKTSMWSFDFEVQNESVFNDGDSPLGALEIDCQGVPMVNTINQLKNLDLMLDVTKEKRNIIFVKYNHEQK